MNSSASLEYLLKLLPLNPFILNIGSEDGREVISLLRARRKGVAHFFEPDPRSRAKLIKILDSLGLFGLFNFRRADVYWFAVSNRTGKSLFHQSYDPNRPEHYGSSSLLPANHHCFRKYPWMRFHPPTLVETITLDDWGRIYEIVTETRLPRYIDLIYMDVQGAEHLVIEGGRELLKRTRYLFTEAMEEPEYHGALNRSELLKFLPNFELIEEFGKENILLRNENLT